MAKEGSQSLMPLSKGNALFDEHFCTTWPVVTRAPQGSKYTDLSEYYSMAHKQRAGPVWFCLLGMWPRDYWESGKRMAGCCSWQSLGGVREGCLGHYGYAGHFMGEVVGKKTGNTVVQLLHCFIQPLLMSIYYASGTRVVLRRLQWTK